MDAYFDDEPGYRIRADEFALPEISLESDEASGRRAGDPRLGPRAAGRGDHGRRREAHRGRPRPRPRRARDRPAPPQCRRAVVRRVLGGDARPAPGHLRLPPARVRRPADPPPRALGRRPLLRTLVRRRPGHRPCRGAGVPSLPRRRSGDDDRVTGVVHGATRHRRPRRRPAPGPGIAGRGGRRPGPAGCRTGAAADRGQRRVRRRRPRRADPLGPAAPARWRPGRRAPRLRTRPLRRVAGRAAGRGRRRGSAPAWRRSDDHRRHRCRQGPGRPPAPPGALPARARPGLAGRGGAGARRTAGPAGEGPAGAVPVRPARWLPRRPDRRRPRRPRG